MVRVAIQPDSSVLGSYRLDESRVARCWRRWALIGALGALLAAAVFAFAAGAVPASVSMLGALMIGEGILQSAHIALLPRHAGAGWRLQGSAVYLIAGILLLSVPFTAVLSPTLIVGLTLMVAGLSKSFLAVMLEPLRGWYWLFAVGLVTVTAGLCLLLLAFEASLALIALLVGGTVALDAAWVLLTAWAARRRQAALVPCSI